ncbi:MAG: T9SS type A sorting domain-containing protein [Lentimicrobiaceae bacterium]|nr:T9SS type A sorting domain-containing protein [Lentimicrobiaceae bacterium]
MPQILHAYSISRFLRRRCKISVYLQVFCVLMFFIENESLAQPLSVNATANPTAVCAGTASQLDAVATGGTGNYTYSWVSVPPGFTSNLRNPSVIPGITTTYTVTVTDSINMVSDDVQVSVFQPPTAQAGHDDTVCQGNSYSLNGIATYQSTIIWSTDGDGYFSNPYILNPLYYPGIADIQTGFAILTLTSYPIAPCSNIVSDDLQLLIIKSAYVNAGPDATICNNGTHNLSGSASNFSSILWSTSGDGFFDNDTIFTPNYTPGTLDKANGLAVLSLTASSGGSCPNNVIDNMLLTVESFPEVNAGPDTSICDNATYAILSTAAHFSYVQWTTSGDGSFSNDSIVTPVYTPGTNDLINRSVTLTVSVTPITPCPEGKTDSMVLSFALAPTVNAGNSGIICMDQSFELNGSATDYSSVLWMTSGDGTFFDATSLNTEYNPGSIDIQNGNVYLTLKANGTSLCNGYSEDSLTLSILQQPSIFAGIDNLVCEDETSYPLNAQGTNFSSILWETTGNGTFVNGNSLDATYTIGSQDINDGGVTLIVKAFSVSPCLSYVSDSLYLEISSIAVANAGEDAEICAGDTYQLNGSKMFSNFCNWATSGDGVFDHSDSLNAIYTPGNDDILDGVVTLSLYAWSLLPCTTSGVDAMTITINQVPEINIGNDQQICSGDSAYFNATALHYESLLWTTRGDGTFTNTSSLNSVYIPGSEDIANGSVRLILTANGFQSCGFVTDSLDITIHNAPVINAGEDQEVYIGNSTNLHATVTPSAGTYYIQWEPAFMVSNPHSLDVETVVLEDTITFILYVTNQETGCISSDEIDVNVTMGPVQINVTADPDTVCRGKMVQLQANAQYGSGSYTYYWSSIPAGFSSQIANPVVYPDTTTIYTVIVNDGSTTPSASQKVVVLGSPESYSIVGPQSVKQFEYYNYTVNQTVNVVYLWWVTNGSITAGQGTNNIYVHWGEVGTGEVNVVTIDPMGCNSDTSSIIVYVKTTGIDEYDAKYRTEVFPNPSDDEQWIFYTLPAQSNVKIELFDITGNFIKLLTNEEQSAGEHHLLINKTHFGKASGMFYIKFILNNTIFLRKIIRIN